jgi:hypothetical protein
MFDRIKAALRSRSTGYLLGILLAMFWTNRVIRLLAGTRSDPNDRCEWECESEAVIPVRYNDQTIVVCPDHEQAIYRANNRSILV